ncbi:MAG: hypothetical protein ABSC22_02330 [Roseiarcus sp.]|jgi:hypothetical protein
MIIGSALVSAAAFAIGVGGVERISQTAAGFVDLVAVVSTVVFIGLVERL